MTKVFDLKKKLLKYFSFCVDQASTLPRTQLQTQQHFTGSSVRLQEHSTGESGEHFSCFTQIVNLSALMQHTQKSTRAKNMSFPPGMSYSITSVAHLMIGIRLIIKHRFIAILICYKPYNIKPHVEKLGRWITLALVTLGMHIQLHLI